MPGYPYSEKERGFILDQLRTDQYRINRETFKMWADLWPGFFNGRVRTEYALFLECRRLAKNCSLSLIVESVPVRIRKRAATIPKVKKTKLSDQVYAIIQNESYTTAKRATRRIAELVRILSEENQELKEEVKNLRPYKDIVDRHYSKEVS
jgi:hypothetical protein